MYGSEGSAFGAERAVFVVSVVLGKLLSRGKL